MSNYEATKLYESVIEEVILDSRQDFEDSGIDESTLQELRKIWCQKLSQSGVARFSWDEEAQREEEELARQRQLAQEHQLHGLDVPGPALGDPGTELQLPDLHDELSYTLNGGTAVINNDGNDLSGLQIPGMGANASSVHQQIEDDGGLMLPRIGQSDGTIEFTMYSDKAEQLMQKIRARENKHRNGGQVDGADDFDDENTYNDSDDINSDLDDDVESDKEDDEDGQDEGQIMLCLYDKVQRVKNKWKSTLKEGVANINGRDYVFQKANGESEW